MAIAVEIGFFLLMFGLAMTWQFAKILWGLAMFLLSQGWRDREWERNRAQFRAAQKRGHWNR